ncbi:MAG: energy transducer TonB [Nanoarchaeota archaeon]|nr:energy transducer TonB [Nanoarchaeota archaeon]
MKDKRKSKKADLERWKPVFFEIGLIIVLFLIWRGLEIKSHDSGEKEIFIVQTEDIPEEFIPITEQEAKPPPPPLVTQPTRIDVVSNDLEVEDDLEINVEADQNTVIQEYIPQEEIFEEEEETEEESQIFIVVESMPEFPGGEKGLHEYLAQNLKYPKVAREANISGRVFLTFVVETDGSVTDVRLLRGIGGGCDEEAIRVVEAMPKWSPGKQRGKPVRVQYNIPISFVLK